MLSVWNYKEWEKSGAESEKGRLQSLQNLKPITEIEENLMKSKKNGRDKMDGRRSRGKKMATARLGEYKNEEDEKRIIIMDGNFTFLVPIFFSIRYIWSLNF